MIIMENIRQQFNKVIKSKTVPEMLKNIPWKFTYLLLFFPLILMMLIPAWQLCEDFINPEGQMTTFYGNVRIINNMAKSIGMIDLIIIIAKSVVEKKSLKNVYSSFIPHICFGIVVMFMLLSTVVNGINDYVLYGDNYRGESLISVIMYFAFYFLVAASFSDLKSKAMLIYGYMISSVLIAGIMIVHTSIVPIEAVSQGTGVSAVFSNSNHYGYYLLMNIMTSEVLFIKENNKGLKLLSFISFVINIVVLIINDTLGCYLACFMALIFSVIVLSICDKKFNMLSVLMTIVFIVISLIMSFWYDSVSISLFSFFKDLLTLTSHSSEEEMARTGTGRWRIWGYTVGFIKERPLLGWGLEGITKQLGELVKTTDRPHNEFLQYAAFFGIPASVAYICGVFSVFLNGLKHKYELDIYTIAALVASFGYLVSSAFGNTMYYTSPNFFILLGIAFSTRVKSDSLVKTVSDNKV